MITINLNIEDKIKKVALDDNFVFNSILISHPESIPKIIKSVYLPYKVSKVYFDIVNRFVEFNDEDNSVYPGLIVRTGLIDYAILYLEKAEIDDDYAVKLIDEYIRDIGDYTPKEININKIVVDGKTFLKHTK